MKRRAISIITVLSVLATTELKAQEREKPSFSIETNVLFYGFQGYSIGGYYYLPNSRISLGVGIEGLTYDSDNLMDAAFENGDQLDEVQLLYLARGEVRYHFKDHKEGLYGSVRFGYEEWDVTLGNDVGRVQNGFVSPTIGYIWYPWGRKGFLVQPFFTGILIIGEGRETVQDVEVDLRPFLPNPGLTIGWKF